MSNNQPKPHYQCFICLRRLGYGYDRIGKAFGVKKTRVHKWFKYHKITVERPELVRRIWDTRTPGSRKRHERVNWVARWDERYKNKSQQYLRKRIRSVIWGWFKHNFYPNTAPLIVGCDKEFLSRLMIEKFQPGMTIETYAETWEFDHIIPLAKFDLTDPPQRKAAFHYSNMQPLSPHQNSVKHTKILVDQMPESVQSLFATQTEARQTESFGS